MIGSNAIVKVAGIRLTNPMIIAGMRLLGERHRADGDQRACSGDYGFADHRLLLRQGLVDLSLQPN